MCILYNRIIDKYYIGSRTCSNKIDILNGYNTSSKFVYQIIQDHGIDSFSVVDIKTFDTAEIAIRNEDKLLRSILKKDRCNYMNINFSAHGAIIKSQTHKRIYNILTDKYSYIPKEAEIPDNCRLKTRSIPPNRKGFKKHINLLTGEITNFRPEDNNDKNIILHDEYLLSKKPPKKIVWVTDGVTNKKIRVCEPTPEGWRKGKTVIWNLQKITDGVIDKYISKDESIPEGWRKGSTRAKNNKSSLGLIGITDGINSRKISKDDPIPEGWRKGNHTSGTKIYYLDGKEFTIKKDLLKYLDTTPAKFEGALKKGLIKGLIIKDKNNK